MEVTSTTIFGTLCIALLAVAISSGLPTDDGILDESIRSDDKRPKYMETKDEFEALKDTVYLALQQLGDEGKLDPSVLRTSKGQKVEKRMYMGICMRQSHNHFIPYPCMREGRK